jgi:hypothetical protein
MEQDSLKYHFIGIKRIKNINHRFQLPMKVTYFFFIKKYKKNKIKNNYKILGDGKSNCKITIVSRGFKDP